MAAHKNTIATTKCPGCGKPELKDYRPFCSKHCSDADLGRWFSGAYAIPGEPVPREALPVEEDEPDRS